MRAWRWLRAYWRDDPETCYWCQGRRVFDSRLPMACPACDGVGRIHRRSRRRIQE